MFTTTLQTYFQSLQDFNQFDFLFTSLITIIFLSLTMGFISPFILYRKKAFMGSAISHSSLLGLAIAQVTLGLDQAINSFFLTLMITVFTTFFLAYSTYNQQKLGVNKTDDSAIGIFYTSSMALGIIIHQLFSKTKNDLLSFLFGNVLFLSTFDLWLSAILCIFVFLIFGIFFSKWIYLTIDEEDAALAGLNPKLFHYLFYLILTLVIVISIKIAGTLLIETMLLVPGFFALNLKLDLKKTFYASIAFSLCSSLIGLTLANAFNLPPGATLSITQVIILFLGFIGIKLFKYN